MAVADTAEHKPDAPISGRRQRPGRSHLDEATKMRIVHLHGQGYTYRKIGKEIGRDHSVVSSVVSRWQREGTVKRARGSGRPRKTSPQIDKLIMSAVMADRSVNTTELKGNMDLKNLSKSTISRRIRESGEYLKMDASKVINYPDDRV